MQFYHLNAKILALCVFQMEAWDRIWQGRQNFLFTVVKRIVHAASRLCPVVIPLSPQLEFYNYYWLRVCYWRYSCVLACALWFDTSLFCTVETPSDALCKMTRLSYQKCSLAMCTACQKQYRGPRAFVTIRKISTTRSIETSFGLEEAIVVYIRQAASVVFSILSLLSIAPRWLPCTLLLRWELTVLACFQSNVSMTCAMSLCWWYKK